MTAVRGLSIKNCLQITSLRGCNLPPSNFRAAPFHQSQIVHRPQLQCPRAGKRADVYESLTLLRFPDGTDDDVISDIVDKGWSMQYLAPGPICASAGQLVPLASSPASAPPFTHAVLFRYGQEKLLQTFLDNPRITAILETTAGTAAEGVATLCFTTAVPNELEAIFRRGSEWDEGFELVAALDLQSGSNEADASEFLDLTQQLATSSAFGAVQAAAGRFNSVRKHVGEESNETLNPDFMILVRFETKEQLEAFVQCPPVAAILEGDERSPLKAAWAMALAVAPAENSNSSPQKGSPSVF